MRTRVFIVLAAAVLSLWAIYPPAETIKLGLDLNGGVQLLLRVDTDGALQQRTAAAAEAMRQALARGGGTAGAVDVVDATAFRVSDVRDAARVHETAAAAAPDFRTGGAPGTSTLTFRLAPDAFARLREDVVEQALQTVERRVNELGVAEPLVLRYGQGDELLVQLPGETDVDRAKAVIKSTAQLRLTLVEQGPFPDRPAALAAFGLALPPHLDVLPGPSDPGSPPSFYVVHRSAVLAGTDLRDARQSSDEFNRPSVAFTLTADAGQRFGDFTSRHVNRLLATVLDDRVASVATIVSRIDSEGRIVGLDREEMLQQVITLRSGALPADLEYVAEHMVGASLGADSVRAGVAATAGGLLLVLLFMLGYYRLAGLNALTSIGLNLLILLALAVLIPVHFTLPGIAGLILTIGMGVDSNVLIFERIKEELSRGRTARAAVTAAFDRVWITIVDTHVTSLIAAALLFQFGTSPIRGFATTLTIGLAANVFTAVFVSKTLFDLTLARRPGRGALSIGRIAASLPAIRFTRWRWHAAAVSVAVLLAGAAAIGARGLPLGIDFSGGTAVVVRFSDPAVTEADVRSAVAVIPGDEVVQRYGAAGEARFVVRLPAAEGVSEHDGQEAAARNVTGALDASALPPSEIVERELVSAAAGADLQRRGFYATAASMAGIAAYIGLRFRPSFAIGGIAATVHDVLVTIACLALAGYDLSLNVVAALLTIVGYSVNDTIVVFDRVRENLQGMQGQSLDAVLDASVTQTLSRTVITAGTTLLAVMSIYWFGGEALRGFAFTMLVGIVSGTFSTVFIASSIAAALSKRARRP